MRKCLMSSTLVRLEDRFVSVLCSDSRHTRTLVRAHRSDMINMIKLGFAPKACCWVHRRGQAQSILAVYVLALFTLLVDVAPCSWPVSSEQHSGTIRLYDGRGDGKPLETVERLHRFPVHLMTVRLLLCWLPPKDIIV